MTSANSTTWATGKLLAGKTIILTTHYMEEAQHLCDEIAIMDYGKIIARGTPQELIKRYSPELTVVLPKKGFDLLPDHLGLPYKIVKDSIEFKTEDVNAFLNHLLSHNIDLTDLAVRSPNLETVFLNLTGRHLRE